MMWRDASGGVTCDVLQRNHNLHVFKKQKNIELFIKSHKRVKVKPLW